MPSTTPLRLMALAAAAASVAAEGDTLLSTEFSNDIATALDWTYTGSELNPFRIFAGNRLRMDAGSATFNPAATLDLSAYNEVMITAEYRGVDLEDGEYCEVTVSLDGGSTTHSLGQTGNVDSFEPVTDTFDVSTLTTGDLQLTFVSSIDSRKTDKCLLASIRVGEGAFLGGGECNNVNGAFGTIGGGGFNSADDFGTVVGGLSNTVVGTDGNAVGGGEANTASSTGLPAAICGGTANTASGHGAFVGGGLNNQGTGDHSTVAGGANNVASGEYSTVTGGTSNTASGYASLAMGTMASATHANSMVMGFSGAACSSNAAGSINICANELYINNELIASSARRELSLAGPDSKHDSAMMTLHNTVADVHSKAAQTVAAMQRGGDHYAQAVHLQAAALEEARAANTRLEAKVAMLESAIGQLSARL